jgi:hypothetical protein
LPGLKVLPRPNVSPVAPPHSLEFLFYHPRLKNRARDKRTYYRGVKTKNAQIGERDEAYVRVEIPEVGYSHALDRSCPYRVIENAGHSMRLQIGPDPVRVSLDRVTIAPKTKEQKYNSENRARNAMKGVVCNSQIRLCPKRVQNRPQGRKDPNRGARRRRICDETQTSPFRPASEGAEG